MVLASLHSCLVCAPVILLFLGNDLLIFLTTGHMTYDV